jgi:hypothetical protein
MKNPKKPKLKLPTPKYSLGQQVYVYTKSGIELHTIDEIMLRISSGESIVKYYMSSYEYYNEAQIMPDTNKIVLNQKENLAQLKVFNLTA